MTKHINNYKSKDLMRDEKIVKGIQSRTQSNGATATKD